MLSTGVGLAGGAGVLMEPGEGLISEAESQAALSEAQRLCPLAVCLPQCSICSWVENQDSLSRKPRAGTQPCPGTTRVAPGAPGRGDTGASLKVGAWASPDSTAALLTWAGAAPSREGDLFTA